MTKNLPAQEESTAQINVDGALIRSAERRAPYRAIAVIKKYIRPIESEKLI